MLDGYIEQYQKWYKNLSWYKKLWIKICNKWRSFWFLRQPIKFPIIKNPSYGISIDDIVSSSSYTNNSNNIFKWRYKNEI